MKFHLSRVLSVRWRIVQQFLSHVNILTRRTLHKILSDMCQLGHVAN